jgi:DNA invertase Pin-like site-specific DNA recombinase
MTTKFVIYRRISGGSNQIKSGLGLESQNREIECYLKSLGDYKIIDEYTEIASGKNHKNRPILQSAIEKSVKTNSIILCSRLCRLSVT